MMVSEVIMRIRLLMCLVLVICMNSCQRVEKQVIIDKNSKAKLTEKTVEYSKMELVQLPGEWLLKVPFVMQAPFANWEIHNESCEEAGILLSHFYYLNLPLSKDTANKELLAMIDYQVKKYGEQKDIYTEEIKELADEFYGYNTRVVDGSVDNIKKELINGNPVILLTTAAYLKPEKNDYPEMGYHILVATGYDEMGWIVHDPGTYTGENTHYSYGIMENAMTDYNYKVVVLK